MPGARSGVASLNPPRRPTSPALPFPALIARNRCKGSGVSSPKSRGPVRLLMPVSHSSVSSSSHGTNGTTSLPAGASQGLLSSGPDGRPTGSLPPFSLPATPLFLRLGSCRRCPLAKLGASYFVADHILVTLKQGTHPTPCDRPLCREGGAVADPRVSIVRAPGG